MTRRTFRRAAQRSMHDRCENPDCHHERGQHSGEYGMGVCLVDEGPRKMPCLCRRFRRYAAEAVYTSNIAPPSGGGAPSAGADNGG